MASQREETTTTTFGVTIERPSRSSTPVLTPRLPRRDSLSRPVIPASPLLAPTGVSIPATPTTATPIRHSHVSNPPPSSRIHVTSVAQVISPEPPLPSPYSSGSEMSHHDEKAADLDLEAGVVHHQTAVKTERFSNAATITSPTKVAAVETYEYPVVPTRNASAASVTTSLTAAMRTRTDDEKFAVDGRVRECTMWPSQEELRHRHRREKIMRSCNPLLRLSRRNRIIVSVLIALMVIATAIGIGVGVSKAFHGGVWAGNGRNIPLPVSIDFVMIDQSHTNEAL